MKLDREARVAIHYAPQPDDPLWAAGTSWLGRDPLTNEARSQPDFPAIAEITADARLYGFHATLKPPMHLMPETRWEALIQRAAAVAETIAPFDLPPLAIADLFGFLALCETAPCPPLHALADACVAGFDEFRAPPGDAELARRRRGGLSAEREAMLRRWGYPDVFATWVFHMTLTRRLREPEQAIYRPAAEAHFAPALRVPRRVSDICLFVQRAPGAPFAIAARTTLRG